LAGKSHRSPLGIDIDGGFAVGAGDTVVNTRPLDCEYVAKVGCRLRATLRAWALHMTPHTQCHNQDQPFAWALFAQQQAFDNSSLWPDYCSTGMHRMRPASYRETTSSTRTGSLLGGGLTFRMRKSLRTRFVRLLETMYTNGRTRPHTTKMPQGCGSSRRYVISNPVRSSTLKSKMRVCTCTRTVSTYAYNVVQQLCWQGTD
jgi:hypothetical protein